MTGLLRLALLPAVVCSCFLPAAYAQTPAPSPQTGQTSCYDVNNAATGVCAGTGQDGEKLRGVAWPSPRFTINLQGDGVTPDGTVTDNLTGLIWLRNGNCYNNIPWATAVSNARALASGQCGLADNSTAGQWRLPSRSELESLVNYQQSNSATWLSAQGFSNPTNSYYWSGSSTAYSSPSTNAWVVHIGTGEMILKAKTTTTIYTWMVR